MSSSEPSTTAAGEAAACSKKASVFGHIIGSTSRMWASEPIARSSIHSDDSQTRAMARTAALMPSEPKPVEDRVAQLPAGLGAKVRLLLE
eukprot:4730078-Pleurochrysis_carterae.AAC.1